MYLGPGSPEEVSKRGHALCLTWLLLEISLSIRLRLGPQLCRGPWCRGPSCNPPWASHWQMHISLGLDELLCHPFQMPPCCHVGSFAFAIKSDRLAPWGARLPHPKMNCKPKHQWPLQEVLYYDILCKCSSDTTSGISLHSKYRPNLTRAPHLKVAGWLPGALGLLPTRAWSGATQLVKSDEPRHREVSFQKKTIKTKLRTPLTPAFCLQHIWYEAWAKTKLGCWCHSLATLEPENLDAG